MLINPVGILRRHQREVRHRKTMMTDVSKTKKAPTMRTLDKMWETTTDERNDTEMEDMEMKIVNESINHNRRNQEKSATKANDDDNNNNKMNDRSTQKIGNTIAQFPMAIRFTLLATNVGEAKQQHKNIVEMFTKELEHCEIYGKENEKTNIHNDSSNFTFHERGKVKTNLLQHTVSSVASRIIN